MRPTSIRSLLAVGVIAVALGWAFARLVDAWADRTFPVPWSMALVMAMLAVATWLWARGTKARLAGQPGTKPIDALVVARSAAWAMAISRTATVLAGFFVGVAIALISHWGVAYVREQVIAAVVTIGVSILGVLSGLLLERACRVPPDSGAPSVDPKP
jgi:uncharacterized membrane protein YczE